jgi:hypothetical protein
MKSTITKSLVGILLLIFLATLAVSQEDSLWPSEKETVKTVKDDFLSPAQDVKGNVTPVITGKNLPDVVASQPKARLFSPTSTWSLNLQDTLERAIVLEMCQSENVVFGKGTITVGSTLKNVTATGTFNEKKLNLDVFSDDMTLFRLSLTMNGKSMSGDYNAYSISYVRWKGIAMGKINYT